MALFLLIVHSTLGLLAVFTPSPVTIGGLLLFQAATTACLLATISSTWISLVVFIIFLGGLMVMFAYFTALTPNTMLPSYGHIVVALKAATFSVAATCIQGPPIPSEPDILPNNDQVLTPMEVFSEPNLTTLVLITSLLLLALIMVVKIMGQSSGPLRPFK